jgi:hypothetical protein
LIEINVMSDVALKKTQVEHANSAARKKLKTSGVVSPPVLSVDQ